MRKVFALAFVAIIMLSLAVTAYPQQSAHAQEDTALVLGEWVEGEVTADTPEISYPVDLTAGDILLVELYSKPGTYDLYPMVSVLDSAGNVLATNDDILGATAILEIASDATYTIVATHSGDEGAGEYILRASLPELLVPGSEVSAIINGEIEKEIADVYVIRPEEDGVWAVSFAHDGGDLFPTITLNSWTGDSFEDEQIFEVTLGGVNSGTLNANLTGGTFYLLLVEQAFLSFVFEDVETPVTISVAEAE